MENLLDCLNDPFRIMMVPYYKEEPVVVGKTLQQMQVELSVGLPTSLCPHCGRPEVLDVKVIDGAFKCAIIPCTHGRVRNTSAVCAAMEVSL